MNKYLSNRPSTAPAAASVYANRVKTNLSTFLPEGNSHHSSFSTKSLAPGGKSEGKLNTPDGKGGKERTVVVRRRKKVRTARDTGRVDERKEEEQNLQDMIASHKINYLVHHTHFNKAEVQTLLTLFHNLVQRTSSPGFMDRPLFREMMRTTFGLTDDIMMDQMYYFFDADHEGSISATEWILNLSILLRGTLEEQIRYCFSVYDLNSDGGIGQEEIMVLLQGCLLPVPGASNSQEDAIHLDSDGVRELASMILHKLDHEKTGQITLKNFRRGCLKNPLLMQSLGECLPQPGCLKAFSALYAEEYTFFETNYSNDDDPTYKNLPTVKLSLSKVVKAKVALQASKTAQAKVKKMLHQSEATENFRRIVRKLRSTHSRIKIPVSHPVKDGGQNENHLNQMNRKKSRSQSSTQVRTNSQ